MSAKLHRMAGWLLGWLPKSLTGRVTLAMVFITVSAGLITVWTVGFYLKRHLHEELIHSGETLSRIVGNTIAIDLQHGDFETVHQALTDIVAQNPDVVCAVVLESGEPLVRVCKTGLSPNQCRAAMTGSSGTEPILHTERGAVRIFTYRPDTGYPLEFYLGISQRRMNEVQGKVTIFVVVLTAAGCAAAAMLAVLFSRVATYSLHELIKGIQRFRAGKLDGPIALPAGGETGDLAEAFNRMREELLEKEHSRNRLLNQIINAQEEERRRIARELHDGLGQSLNALVFGLNTVGKTVSREPESAVELMARLNVSVSETIKELQNIIYDLRPSLLDDHGLIKALDWLADERLRDGGIDVTFDTERALDPIPQMLETALFRIGQEAVTNIQKYAQAQTVRIRLETSGSSVELEVCDNGIGFDTNDVLKVKDKRRGWGLLGMRERASLLGGQLTIESQPGQGTRLLAVIPLGGVEE